MNTETVAELAEAEQVLLAPTREVREAYHEPVTFTARDSQGEPVTKKARNVVAYHTVETGILWIPPFEYDFWSWRKAKPAKVKCTCEHCGHTHSLKGGR
jgi:hypothetical protein